MARSLSIVIPVRNGAATLPRLLDRLAALRRPAGWQVEVVAGYAPSSDATLRILQARGVAVATAAAPGPAAARNAAVALAKGDFLWFIDADAFPVAEDVLIRLAALVTRLGAFGALGGPVLLDPNQRRNPIAVADHLACWFNWTAERRFERSRLFQPSVNLVLRRQALAALGGFDPRRTVLEDQALQARMLQRGWPIYFHPALAVAHRARGGLLASWRHSWRWGRPFRYQFADKFAAPPFSVPVGDRRFWRNLPALWRDRMRLVLRSAERAGQAPSGLVRLFLAATVLAWCLGVVWGDPGPMARAGKGSSRTGPAAQPGGPLS